MHECSENIFSTVASSDVKLQSNPVPYLDLIDSPK